jgi:hypothetical protein
MDIAILPLEILIGFTLAGWLDSLEMLRRAQDTGMRMIVAFEDVIIIR